MRGVELPCGLLPPHRLHPAGSCQKPLVLQCESAGVTMHNARGLEQTAPCLTQVSHLTPPSALAKTDVRCFHSGRDHIPISRWLQFEPKG